MCARPPGPGDRHEAEELLQGALFSTYRARGSWQDHTFVCRDFLRRAPSDDHCVAVRIGCRVPTCGAMRPTHFPGIPGATAGTVLCCASECPGPA